MRGNGFGSKLKINITENAKLENRGSGGANQYNEMDSKNLESQICSARETYRQPEDDEGSEKEEEEMEEIEHMANATDFEGNMKTFINNYGVSIDIPNYYPLGAAIFPQNP